MSQSDLQPMTSSAPAWEVKSPPQNSPHYGHQFFVERATPDDPASAYERAAICFDYGVACVIEAVMNLRDGTVE